MKEKNNFADRHPYINMIIAIIILLVMIIVSIFITWRFVIIIGRGIDRIRNFLNNFLSNTDKVIVVAMITGSVSITGVIISSLIGKIVEHRYNIKKYLYDKREKPYEQFIAMVYMVMEDTKKTEENRMSEEEMIKIVSEFSKGLTLWGSNRVVKKWLKFRAQSINGGGNESLLILEDIIYEIRKDIGLRKKLKKGDMLSFFINDIDVLRKKQ